MPLTMTKRELVIRVANNLGMTQSDIARIIEGTFDAISEALAEGHRWELRDFGVFEVKTRASRIGRNPRTGDQVPVPERRVVTFRPGKKMKEMVATGEVVTGEGGEDPMSRYTENPVASAPEGTASLVVPPQEPAP
jgi:nucleoid DNA-binding protein